ncbi:Proactivator polypeptide-like 1 [Folsomia candida]|uniref:Proactivator polypeptide-like 1 n=2 Tax=Folsomia candida TaxID=158441 RepID=A0A226EIE5_FOLCA|nr:Proactivator polypeptide-like 1 [Folsomia candida]
MITQRLVAFTKLIGLAFIVILCGHVGPYVHGADRQELNCNLRLNDLCHSLRQADACHTIPYCIHCVWNTALIPKEDVDKCQMCKDEIIEGSRNQIDIIPLFQSTCKLHGNEEDVQRCTQLVENFSLRLIHEISTQNITTHDVCSLLALCRALFEVSVTSVDAASIEDLKPIASENTGGGSLGVEKSGGGRGGGGFALGGRGTVGTNKGSGRGSISGAKARGSVNRVEYGSQYHGGGGWYVPIFIANSGGGRGRHTCNLQEERDEYANFYALLHCSFVVVFIIFCVYLLSRRRRDSNRNEDI